MKSKYKNYKKIDNKIVLPPSPVCLSCVPICKHFNSHSKHIYVMFSYICICSIFLYMIKQELRILIFFFFYFKKSHKSCTTCKVLLTILWSVTNELPRIHLYIFFPAILIIYKILLSTNSIS